MTGADAPAPAPPPEAPAGGPAAGASPAVPTRGDRILLVVFCAYVLLLAVAAFAQVTDNRALLDLFDLRRLFTR